MANTNDNRHAIETTLEQEVLEVEIQKENAKNISNSLALEVPETKKRQNDFVVEKGQNENREYINNANNKVLIDYLSPEISKNEKAKRVQKYILIGLLALFLVVQFIATYSLSTKIIEYACNEQASSDIVNALLYFATGYITSVVVELIAILKYIVQNVFDTSIAELVKIFKEDNKNE